MNRFLLRSSPAPDRPRLVDLRGLPAHRRDHPRTAAPVPAGRIERSLYLLPPRPRPLIVLGRNGAEACRWAEALAARGFTQVGWLDGSPLALDPRTRTSGREPNRIWEPNPWLRRLAPRLPQKGQTCDLACGSGRDAVFLALGGRRVLAVDRLPDALRQGRALARAACIPPPGTIRFACADLTRPSALSALLRPGRFSVIVSFRYLDRALFGAMTAALAPGGWLLLQAFLERQAEIGRRPRNRAYLLKPGELRAAFNSLALVDYHEGPDGEGNWLASIAARRR